MAFLMDTTTLVLAFAALLAGIVDSIAGGGGLITLPVLLLSGVPPISTLGTSKLQSLFGSLSATLAYAHAGQVRISRQWQQALFALLGGFIGALVATVLPIDILQALLPILLLLVALYFGLKPNLNDRDKAEQVNPKMFCLTMAPLIGFYDGVFGPGAGSFYMLAFVVLAGYGMLKATAHTKLLNFSSNVGGFVAFALVGTINWRLGIVMGIAQFIGAQIGARLALRAGARLIKPLLVITCLCLTIKLLSDPNNPIHHFFNYVISFGT